MEYQKTTGMSTHSLDAASLINVVYQTFCKIKDLKEALRKFAHSSNRSPDVRVSYFRVEVPFPS